jgi:tetratricopeptide (TPR) repeat protein
VNRFKFLICISILLPTLLAAQELPSLSEIQALFDDGQFSEAQNLIEAYLSENPGDRDAQRLQNNIEQELNKIESAALTEEAVFQIEETNFNQAYILLEQAVLLDPDNERALDLFVRLQEVVDLEEVSRLEEAQASADNQVQDQSSANNESTTSDDQTVEDSQAATTNQADSAPADDSIASTDSEELKEEPASDTPRPVWNDHIKTYVPLNLTFSGSDVVEGVSSFLLLGGTGLSFEYSPGFLDNLIWLILSYDGDFFTAIGDDRVSYTMHDIVAKVGAQLKLFPQDEVVVAELLGVIGYNLFLLNNSADEGLYYFNLLYSPTFGFTVRDHILARFFEGDLYRKLKFKFSFELSFIPIPDDTIWMNDFYFGAEYKISDFLSVYLGDKLFINSASNVTEIFNRIGIGAALSF